MIDYKEMEAKLILVAAKMMSLKNNGMEEKYPISLIDIDCWEWPQGVGLFGLYKYYTVSKNRDTLKFLIDWFDARMEEGIPEKNVNTTAPMLTLSYIYEYTQDPRYLSLINEWVDWIMKDKKLIRIGDGCFQHMITGDTNDGEILIDTIFMTLLFLARAGKLLYRQDCINEVNYQILNHIKYLFDKKEGLFFHGFNFNCNTNYGEVYWARGNSWYTITIMELLEEVEIDEAIKRYFLSVYKAQTSALIRYANKDTKLWHTVINDDSSYIEISGSAAFLYGIMQGVRKGILDKKEYQPLIEKAIPSLMNYIDDDGTVLNVSYGTPIGEDAKCYKKIPCCPMTYGQALMILCLQEMMLDYWH